MKQASAAIEFRSATKRFPSGTVALADVSWSVARGAHACLLGPNGAGKSTSIRLLEGVLQPTSGSVELLGAAAGTAAYLAARRRTGIVPQGPGMYPDLTAGEYLRVVSRVFGVRAGGPLEAFGLGDHLDTPLSRLSGGYQRRVLLAAAVLSEPEVLLLDEPTVGLDPVATRDVHEYLRGMMPGRTVLLCTHNLAEAEALCDEVVIMRGGHVILRGSLASLRRRVRPKLRLTARQGVQALLAHLDGTAASVRSGGGSVLVECADPPHEAPALLKRLLSAGVGVYECVPVEATLEDLFLEAVR